MQSEVDMHVSTDRNDNNKTLPPPHEYRGGIVRLWISPRDFLTLYDRVAAHVERSFKTSSNEYRRRRI